MISLQNDYSEGAHPQILKRLAEINLEQNPGYCSDTYCAGAAEKIRKDYSCRSLSQTRISRSGSCRRQS